MKEVGALLSIFVAALIGCTQAECPCSATSGKLTCSDGTIYNFPEDLQAEGCHFDFQSIWAIEIQNQPVQILKDNAFSKFSNLLQISSWQIQMDFHFPE